MIFISTPYTHKYEEVIRERMKIVAYYAANLLEKELIPIAPVLMGDRIRQEVNISGSYDAWDSLCTEYLKGSSEMHILLLDGWMESNGVDAEIILARRYNIPIKYIEFFQPIPNGQYHFRENDTLSKKEKMHQKIDAIKKEIIERKANQ